MGILDTLKAGFALGVPASKETLDRIADGILVHRTFVKYLPRIVTRVARKPDGFANCEVNMTGDFGAGPFELLRATTRDHRIVDFNVFQSAGAGGFTDFVYFFLGEPEAWQIAAQNYGGEGEFAVIRVRGADLLADKRRKIFYRRGLFWEADRAVIVKGGYRGPAKVEPLAINLGAPLR